MAAVIAAETIGAATGGPGRLPYALHQALNSSYGVGTNGSIWIKSPLRKRTGGPLAPPSAAEPSQCWQKPV